jgi:molybdate transport repressor ModE-like protein
MVKEPNIESLKLKLKIGTKFWLKFENNNILGSGWAELLENIEKNEKGSLTQAAKACNRKKKQGYSYKYAWNILKRIEMRTGYSPVETGKGGSGGGGWVKLNEWGRFLLNTYKELVQKAEEIEKKIEQDIKTN